MRARFSTVQEWLHEQRTCVATAQPSTHRCPPYPQGQRTGRPGATDLLPQILTARSACRSGQRSSVALSAPAKQGHQTPVISQSSHSQSVSHQSPARSSDTHRKGAHAGWSAESELCRWHSEDKGSELIYPFTLHNACANGAMHKSSLVTGHGLMDRLRSGQEHKIFLHSCTSSLMRSN